MTIADDAFEYLKENPGKQLLCQIHRAMLATGVKSSPGGLYAALIKLKKMGLVSSERVPAKTNRGGPSTHGSVNVYGLTPQGHKATFAPKIKYGQTKAEVRARTTVHPLSSWFFDLTVDRSYVAGFFG